jgi:hypothetical protein
MLHPSISDLNKVELVNDEIFFVTSKKHFLSGKSCFFVYWVIVSKNGTEQVREKTKRRRIRQWRGGVYLH